MDIAVLNSGKLKQGARGDAVVEVRTTLHQHGYAENASVADPALFDAWMTAAVMDAQRKRGLKVDGIVGPKTWAALTAQVQPTNLTTQPTETQPPVQSAAASNMPMLLAGVGVLAIAAYYLSQRKSLAGYDGDGDDENERDRIAARTSLKLRRMRAPPPRDPVAAEIAYRAEELKADLAEGRITRAELKEELARLEARYGRGGRGPTKGLPTYTTQKLTAGQRFLPGSVRKPGRRTMATTETISRELRRMSQRAPDAPGVTRQWSHDEEQLWQQKDREDAVRTGRVGPSGATARIPVSAKLYKESESYRDQAQDRARSQADREKRRVTIVDEGGRVLFDYLPPVHRYGGLKKRARKLGDMGDALSEKMISAVKRDAMQGNCPKAVKQLPLMRGLIRTGREEALYDEAVNVVQRNCEAELAEEADVRSEIHRDMPAARVKFSPGMKGQFRVLKRRVEKSSPFPKGAGRPKKGSKVVSATPIRLNPKDKSVLPANIYLSKRAAKARMVRTKK